MLVIVSGRLSRRIAIAVITLLSALVVRTLPAQDDRREGARDSASAVLTLRDVYSAIGRGTPRVRAAASLARAAEARVPGTRRPPDPVVQLGLMNYMLPDFASDPVLGMRQLQVMQMVPLPGKLGAAYAAAAARAQAAGALVDDARAEVRAAAAMAFLDRWSAVRQALLAIETRRLLADAAAVASAMYRVGEAQQADVLRAQVEIARMDEMGLRMRAMSDGALVRLAALLDAAPSDVSAPPELPHYPDSLPPVDSLVALALGARPMLSAGAAQLEAASADVRAAERERWPDPQVGLQFGSRRSTMGTERMGSLMVGATIPIWARSRQLQMREEAMAMRAMAEADLSAMRAETRGRIGEAHAAIASARRLATLYLGTVLPQAEAAAMSALSAYRAGAVDFMTVVENRMTVNTYRRELVALNAAEALGWVELEMLLGRSLMTDTAAQGAR